jgi:hypothetical protein
MEEDTKEEAGMDLRDTEMITPIQRAKTGIASNGAKTGTPIQRAKTGTPIQRAKTGIASRGAKTGIPSNGADIMEGIETVKPIQDIEMSAKPRIDNKRKRDVFGGSIKLKGCKKVVLGKERRIYTKKGSKKEYIKHKGEYLTIKEYIKIKSIAKPATPATPKRTSETPNKTSETPKRTPGTPKKTPATPATPKKTPATPATPKKTSATPKRTQKNK